MRGGGVGRGGVEEVEEVAGAISYVILDLYHFIADREHVISVIL